MAQFSRNIFQSVFILNLILGASSLAIAQEVSSDKDGKTEGRAFAFYLENDSKNIGGPGSDQGYSAGFKFSYIFAENKAPPEANGLLQLFNFLDPSISNSKVNFGISLGQQLYTPNDTESTQFNADDRPYAAWLYLGFAASFKEEHVGHFFEFNIGTIGPSAQGEQVQNNFHRLIRESTSKGWDHSLHDEPTLQLFYQKRFRSWRNSNIDFFPYYGLGFGNVQIGAHIGGLVRAGVNLPDDFGPSRPSASDGDSFVAPVQTAKQHQWSYYAFAGTRGNGLLRNAFLDGNSFRNSHHVKKYPFTFETEFGAGLQKTPYVVVWRFVTRSPEFEERSIFNSFACLNFMYLF